MPRDKTPLQTPGLCHYSLHKPNGTVSWSPLSPLCCPRAMDDGSGCARQGGSEGLLRHGDAKLSLLPDGRSLKPCWEQQVVLPGGSGLTMPSPGTQGCAKRPKAHLGGLAVRTTAKPRVVCKSHLPEIEQAQQCSSSCIPYPVPRVLLLRGSSVGSAHGKGLQCPSALTGTGAGAG